MRSLLHLVLKLVGSIPLALKILAMQKSCLFCSLNNNKSYFLLKCFLWKYSSLNSKKMTDICLSIHAIKSRGIKDILYEVKESKSKFQIWINWKFFIYVLQFHLSSVTNDNEVCNTYVWLYPILKHRVLYSLLILEYYLRKFNSLNIIFIIFYCKWNFLLNECS